MRKSSKKIAPDIFANERARLLLILRTIPRALLAHLSASQLIKTYKFNLGPQTVWQVKNDFLKGEKGMPENDEWVPKAENIGAQLVIERIAGVSSKTYSNLGDGELIGSEDALRMINSLLVQYDPSILRRNLKRRVAR
jgi:hypothetical protein